MAAESSERGHPRAIVRVNCGVVLGALLAIAATLSLLHLGSRAIVRSGSVADDPWLTHIVLRLFDANEETTLHSMWSICLLAAVAAIAVVIGLARRNVGDRSWRWWIAAGAIAATLSLDESVALHESLGEAARVALGPSIAAGPVFYVWVVPAAISVVLCLVVFSPFIVRLPRGIMLEAGAGVALYVVGAIGLQMVYAVLSGVLNPARPDEAVVLDTIIGVEEFLEVLGASLVLHALLRHLRDHVLARAPLGIALR
jgi:hypothetical protein